MLLTVGAQRDLEAIDDFIAEADGQASADHVLEQLLDVSERLAEFPERAAHPKELLALGIHEYRQVFFQPYRVIHRVIGHQLFITLIADRRRDMHSLLARRLLEEWES